MRNPDRRFVGITCLALGKHAVAAADAISTGRADALLHTDVFRGGLCALCVHTASRITQHTFVAAFVLIGD